MSIELISFAQYRKVKKEVLKMSQISRSLFGRPTKEDYLKGH